MNSENNRNKNKEHGLSFVQRRVVDEFKRAYGLEAPLQKFRIRLHCKRHCLLDWRNAYDKPFVDACGAVGLIRDDAPEYCQGIEESQEKIPTSEEEEIIITIEEMQ